MVKQQYQEILKPVHHKDSSDVLDHQDENISSSVTWSTYLYVFCAALNSCNLGYDIGVSTNAGPKIQEVFGLSNTQLELFLGSINFWSIFGAVLSPFVTDRYGRRWTFGVAAIFFLFGVGVMTIAKDYTQLMVGRMIVGLGVGCGEAIDPMYISEISPAKNRGELVSFAEAGVAFGVVLGFASSLIFRNMDEDPDQGRYMLGLGGVFP
jgi:MFS family permease